MDKKDVMIVAIYFMVAVFWLTIICQIKTLKPKFYYSDFDSGEYDKIYTSDWVKIYDTSTYACTDIWENVIVPIPCWYLESKGLR